MSSGYTIADYEVVITNYTPHTVCSEPWSHAVDFTREYVRTSSITPDNTSCNTLHNMLNCVSKLTAWVWVSYGVMTAETIFHSDIIGNYFLAGDGTKLSPPTAETRRLLLCHAMEVTNDD